MFNNFKKPLFLGLIALTVANSVFAAEVDPALRARAVRFFRESFCAQNKLWALVLQSSVELRPASVELRPKITDYIWQIQRGRDQVLRVSNPTPAMMTQAEDLLVGAEAVELAWDDVVQTHRCPVNIIVEAFDIAWAFHYQSRNAQVRPFGHGNSFLGMNVAELSLAVNEFLLAQGRRDDIRDLAGMANDAVRHHAEIRLMTQHRIAGIIDRLNPGAAARPGRLVRPRSRSRSRSGSRSRRPSGAAADVGAPARPPQPH